MSRADATLGYLMSEEQHGRIMRGIDSLRFLEGLLCTAVNAPVTPCFDLDDLAGYLQLLLEHTYEPLKALEFQSWAPAPRSGPKPNAAAPEPAETEEELLRLYRAMSQADRRHFLRVGQALAGAIG